MSLDPDRSAVDQISDRAANARILQHVDLRLGDVQMDLHFDPFKVGLPTRRLDSIWLATETLTAEFGTITVLDPTSELMLMLLHLNKDSFSMLGAFLDVRRIVESGSVDWESLARVAEAEGLEVPVWSSLATVADILGLKVDGWDVDGIRARSWKRVWRAALQGYEGRESAPRRQRLLALHARRRTGDQMRELRRQLLPQRDLLEVAGRLSPGRPYFEYLSGRFRKGPGATGSAE